MRTIHLGFIWLFSLCFNISLFSSLPLAETKAKALEGDIQAQIQLGSFYNRGESKDYLEAYYWMRKAANSDHPIACRYLGRAHLLGQGTSRNIDLGQNWLLKAANQGDAYSMFDLAKSMDDERIVEKLAWYKIADLYEHPTAIQYFKKITDKFTYDNIQLQDMILKLKSKIVHKDFSLTVPKQSPKGIIKRMILPNGESYWGQIKKGKPNGYGIKKLNESIVYQGNFKDGYEHGFGISYGKNGIKTFQGIWKNGKPTNIEPN